MKKRAGERKLGTVLHLVDKKLIVRGGRLRVEGVINSIVMSENKRKIGRVYDIFGPVNRPYVSIKIHEGIKEEELKKLVHNELYVL
jgi:RNA-binding protein